MNLEKIYKEVQPNINYFVNKFNSIDRDDILSLANETFMDAAKNYKQERSSFKTYFSTCLARRLSRLSKKMAARNLETSVHDLCYADKHGENQASGENHHSYSDDSDNQERRVIFKAALESLSEDAHTIINNCFNNDDGLLKESYTKGRTMVTQRSLRDYMFVSEKLNYNRFNKAWVEIKGAIF